MSNTSIIQLSNVTKRYGGFTAVDDVDLDVHRGSIHALIGPNGAGKTTCFNLLTKFLQPSSGSILFKGRDITRLPIHARARLGLGYLPQEASVFRKLSVADNILAILETRDDLDEAGYRVLEPSNAGLVPVTRVEFQPGYCAEAVGLADVLALPGTQVSVVEPGSDLATETPPTHLTVTLGRDSL